jgi:hypothetical protein
MKEGRSRPMTAQVGHGDPEKELAGCKAKLKLS